MELPKKPRINWNLLINLIVLTLIARILGGVMNEGDSSRIILLVTTTDGRRRTWEKTTLSSHQNRVKTAGIFVEIFEQRFLLQQYQVEATPTTVF
jgi:hypothetical protein